MSTKVQAERQITENENAVLVELVDGREIWIPFSQCDKILRRPDGSLELTVSDWLARKEDL